MSEDDMLLPEHLTEEEMDMDNMFDDTDYQH